MSNLLFEKIINNLSEIKFEGRLSLYNNSEALLDERIFEFISLARKKLPYALLEIKTNGILLNEKNFIELYNSGLDKLCINDYTPSGKLSKRISKLKTKILSTERFRKTNNLEIYGRLNNEVLGSRAGNSPNKKITKNPLANQPCFRPAEMMTITPEGNVSVCSEDQYCEFNMGNLITSNVEELWYSDKWSKLRKELMHGSRATKKLCSQCDYRGFSLGLFESYDIPILLYSFLVSARTRVLNIKKIKKVLRRLFRQNT